MLTPFLVIFVLKFELLSNPNRLQIPIRNSIASHILKRHNILNRLRQRPFEFLHLFNIISKNNSNHRTRNSYNIPQFNIKHNFFKNSIFPSVIAEWNKLDSDIQNLNSLSLFKSRILKLIRPNPNSTFNCHNSKAIKYLSGISLGLSHVREHKFKHNIQDTLNPICACRSDIETPCQYFISCPIFDAERSTLLNNIRQIAPSILNLNHSQITHVLLYSDSSLKNETNTEILNSILNYILSPKRFESSIL